MTRQLAITARQVTALCKGAGQAGYIPEVIIGNVTVRLVPERLARDLATVDEEPFLGRNLTEFGRGHRRTEPIAPTSRKRDLGDPLREYYDSIGFDPLTMGDADRARLVREAEEKWKASIPGTPLGKRERQALAQLAAHGVGVAVHWSKIKNCGPDTKERLEARGFLKTENQTKFPDRIDTYILTEAGLREFKAQEEKGGYL